MATPRAKRVRFKLLSKFADEGEETALEALLRQPTFVFCTQSSTQPALIATPNTLNKGRDKCPSCSSELITSPMPWGTAMPLGIISTYVWLMLSKRDVILQLCYSTSLMCRTGSTHRSCTDFLPLPQQSASLLVWEHNTEGSQILFSCA